MNRFQFYKEMSINIPKNYSNYRNWVGDSVSIDIIIDDYNKVMDGGEFEIIGYDEGVFIGCDINGEELKLKPNDIFDELNVYYR